MIFQNQVPILKYMQYYLYIFYQNQTYCALGFDLMLMFVSVKRERDVGKIVYYVCRYLTPFSYEKNNRPLGESKSLNKKKFRTRSRKHDIFYLVML